MAAQQPSTVATPERARGYRLLIRRHGVLLLLMVLSAAAAMLIAHQIFPALSADNDEPLYLMQAHAFVDGHLFVPVHAPMESYRPWMAAVHDGHYVLKYTPVVPAVLALSLLLTGTYLPALGLFAALGVLVTYLLARCLTERRRAALFAAGLFAVSPLVIVQSGLVLAYLPTLVLLESGILAAVRAVRGDPARPARGWQVLAGLSLGLAFVSRAYDTVLVAGPMLLWAVVSVWRAQPAGGPLRGVPARLGALAARLWPAVAGALGPLLLLLWWDWAATGKPTQLPFALLEPQDKLGYGIRRLFPSDIRRHFTFGNGLAGIGTHLWMLGIWAAAGALLAALVVFAVVRRRVHGPVAALAVVLLTLPVGYLFFWGAYNAAYEWKGIRYIGPFYALPLLVPLVVIGGRELERLSRRPRRRPLLAAVAVVIVVLDVVVLVPALRADAGFSDSDRRVTRAIEAAAAQSVVFSQVRPPFLQHPGGAVTNGTEPTGDVVYAVDLGTDDFTVLDQHPGHVPLQLRYPGSWHHRPGDHGAAAVLRRLVPASGPSVAFKLQIGPVKMPKTSGLLLAVTVGEQVTWYTVPAVPAPPAASSSASAAASTATKSTMTTAPLTVPVQVRAAGTLVTGLTPIRVEPAVHDLRHPLPTGAVQIVLVRTGPRGLEGPVGTVDWTTLPTRPASAGVEVLAPGDTLAFVGPGDDSVLRLSLA